VRVLVWGAGAIGGTNGAYLARAGHDVAFVGRGADPGRAAREGGVHIEGPLAAFTRSGERGGGKEWRYRGAPDH